MVVKGEKEAGEEAVDAVDKEGGDMGLGILMLVVMMNGKLQASMEIGSKLIISIVLKNTSGSIYLRMYAID